MICECCHCRNQRRKADEAPLRDESALGPVVTTEQSANEKDGAEHLPPPLVRLPPCDWIVKECCSEHFAVSVYGRVQNGNIARHWQRWSIRDFPNDLIGFIDLEAAGLMGRYIAAIGKSEVCGTVVVLDGTAEGLEPDKLNPLDDGILSPVVGTARKAPEFLFHGRKSSSVVGGTPTVAGAGDVSSVPGEGAA